MRGQSLRRALADRCPRCGEGKLFRSFSETWPACTHCGLDYAAADTGDGPSFLVLSVLCIGVTPFALWQGMVTAWPLWAIGLLWGAVILGAAVLALRPARALFIALQFANRQDRFNLDP